MPEEFRNGALLIQLSLLSTLISASPRKRIFSKTIVKLEEHETERLLYILVRTKIFLKTKRFSKTTIKIFYCPGFPRTQI